MDLRGSLGLMAYMCGLAEPKVLWHIYESGHFSERSYSVDPFPAYVLLQFVTEAIYMLQIQSGGGSVL